MKSIDTDKKKSIKKMEIYMEQNRNLLEKKSIKKK
jgi:hypothetical protein